MLSTPTAKIHDIIVFLYDYRNLNGSSGGELYLGGKDPSHYSGNEIAVKLSDTTYWKINMDG